MAEALAEAHTRGVIHRDLKPSNVMVTESRRVKVLDFGLAKHQPLGDEASSTWSRDPGHRSAAGALLGTVAYMSPEQALGRDVDPRSDIFSLGVVFYELLAGRPPFTGAGLVEVFDALLREDPAPLPARLTDPRIAQVERILRMMMAKDRERRYPSLREVCQDLAAVQRGTAPTAVPPAASAPAVAVLGFANITGSGEDDWLGTGIGHLAALQGRHAEAVQQFQRELAFVQRVEHALRSRILIELHMHLGGSQLALGDRQEAEAALQAAIQGFERRVRMGADDPFTRYYAAGVHALRGEREQALACLERAAGMRRRFTLERARIEPEFDGLRDEPRFRELVGGG